MRWIRALFAQTPGSFYVLTVMVFIAVPALLASQNEISVFSIPPWSWMRLLLLGMLALSILAAISRILGDLALGVAFRSFVTFTAFFVVCSGFLLPVSFNAGLVNANQAELNVRNLLLCLLVAAAMLALHGSEFRSSLGVGVGVYIIANLGWVVISADHNPALYFDDSRAAASSTQNVFVVSFDGLSGSALKQIVLDDPVLQKDLAGFVVYEYAASSSPTTSESVAAELYGNRDFKQDYSTQSELWNSDPAHLLTNVLARSGYRVATYGEYRNNLADTGVVINPGTQLKTTAHMLLKAAIGRTLSRVFVPSERLDRALGEFLTSPDKPDQSESELLRRIRASQIPDWSMDMTPTVVDFRSFVTHLSVGTAEPAAFFLHFTHTHFPIQFDSDCEFRGDDPEWYSANQNRDGDLKQSRCAALQFAAFVKKVEQLGILDKSMIVLKSDHGRPPGYAAPGSIEESAIRGNRPLGFARYAPFLAIRSFGKHRASDALEWDTSPVLLDDLARTICFETQILYDCETFPGYNIVRESPPSDSEITLFVAQSESSNHTLDGYEAVTFTRGGRILESLASALRPAELNNVLQPG